MSGRPASGGVESKGDGNLRAEGIERLEWLAHHTARLFAVWVRSRLCIGPEAGNVQNETGFGRVGIVGEVLELVLMHYGKKL